MKQCPKCGNRYTDDTLNFCLADGSALADADEQPTMIRGGDPNKTEQLPANITQAARDGMRVDIQTSTQAEPAFPTQQTKTTGSPLIKIILAVIALGLLVVLGASVFGVVFYFYSGNRVVVSTSPTPVSTPWAVPSSSPKSDESTLEDEIAKLKKQLDDSTNSNVDVTINEDDIPGFGRTAVVNSPKDGFLALRNLPSSDIGERIAKIPHGEKISVLMCSEQSTTIAGRSGHWCMATYKNQTGWVFDVWLSFATDSKN